MQTTNRSIIWKAVLLILFLGVMIALTVLALPYIKLLSQPNTQAQFKSWVHSLGVGGWFVVLGIQVFQIIIAFIPGGPVEILSGVLYGGFGGLLICLIGSVIASSVIILLSKKIGEPVVAKLFKKNKTDEFAFLKDARKLEAVVFFLFLIPGIPKDMLTYIVGVSPMKLSKFLLISTFARIPAIIASTFIGSTMRQGKWEIALTIFLVTAVSGILGIDYKDRMIAYCKKVGSRIKAK